jgi:hypothetical protein
MEFTFPVLLTVLESYRLVRNNIEIHVTPPMDAVSILVCLRTGRMTMTAYRRNN